MNKVIDAIGKRSIDDSQFFGCAKIENTLSLDHGRGSPYSCRTTALFNAVLETSSDPLGSARSYRAITRHTDGRIIHVRDLRADSDAEAIRIVTARGADIRTDLYGEDGLVQRFGVPEVEPVTPGH